MTESSAYDWDAYDPVPDRFLETHNAISRELGEKVLSADTYNETWLQKISDEFGGEQ